MRLIRRALDVLAVAALAIGAISLYTAGAGAQAGEPRPVAKRAGSVVAPAPLGPVTVHEIDVPAAPPGTASGSSMVQVVKVEVRGGSLSLTDDRAEVALVRHGRTWSGELPAVRVVDARGTHAGWTVRWAVADIEVSGCVKAKVRPSHVRVDPAEPVAVHGLPDGVHAGRSSVGAGPARTLMRAAPGWGGGTYVGGGTATLRIPGCTSASSVVVTLNYSVS
jgi:hypothetical protein